MARIDKFRKDYAARMGGVRMYYCPLCHYAGPTWHSVLGHLFCDHELDVEYAKMLMEPREEVTHGKPHSC